MPGRWPGEKRSKPNKKVLSFSEFERRDIVPRSIEVDGTKSKIPSALAFLGKKK